MASKKTWLWIIAAGFGLCVFTLLAVAAAGMYFVSQHVDAARSSGADAMRSFEAARETFKDPPLFEIDALERVRATRAIAKLPTSKRVPTHLWVLAWDPNDERLVKVSLPFWLLRLGRRNVEISSGGFDLEQLNLDVQELERVGPMLVIDHRATSGERVLIWTQ